MVVGAKKNISALLLGLAILLLALPAGGADKDGGRFLEKCLGTVEKIKGVDTEAGFARGASFGTGLLTPDAGAVRAEGEERAYRVGGRLLLNGRRTTGLELHLEGPTGTGRRTALEPGPPTPGHLGLLNFLPLLCLS